ncbi:hypothetical protein GCM10027360_11500 [Amycolatopsis echigonensis]
MRAKNIPAAGGVLPLRPDRLGVTGRREQEHRIPFRVWGEQARGAGGSAPVRGPPRGEWHDQAPAEPVFLEGRR